MSDQTKISHFFVRNSPKRVKNDDNEEDTLVQLTEPAKTTTEHTEEASTESTDEPLPPSLENLENFLPPDWRQELKGEFTKPYWKALKEDLITRQKNGEVFYPKLEHIFTAFHLTPLNKVRVVLFGQDPYHGPNQAHGLCFSVLPGIKPPPSLVNMYKELETDIPGFKRPNHGHLENWARQGVFMLNTVLTVKAATANSHSRIGWIQFTDAVVKALAGRKHIVWMLWGNPAQAKARGVSSTNHCIIKSVHPSPLSASRGWFGSKPFSKCNTYLTDKGYPPIDWTL